jgi:hypothetical protein
LCSQLEGKTKELQQQEEGRQEDKTQLYKLAKELEDSNSRTKASHRACQKQLESHSIRMHVVLLLNSYTMLMLLSTCAGSGSGTRTH